jgi:hypothetical protein
MKRKDLVGQTFNSWIVLEYLGKKGWLCRCKCGITKKVQTANLTSGASRSCRQCSSNAVEVKNKLPEGEGAFNDLFNRYKHGAMQRDVEFDLSKLLAKLLFRLPCNYCGDPPYSIWPTGGRSDMNGSFTYSGIDRVDSSKGYISTNIVPCCKRCNIAKRDFNEADFIAHAKKIAAYREAM